MAEQNPRVQALLRRCQSANKDIISTRGKPYKESTLAKKICLKRHVTGELPILRGQLIKRKHTQHT